MCAALTGGGAARPRPSAVAGLARGPRRRGRPKVLAAYGEALRRERRPDEASRGSAPALLQANQVRDEVHELLLGQARLKTLRHGADGQRPLLHNVGLLQFVPLDLLV